MTFEEYLEEQFSKNYSGIKDDWETSLENWESQLDVQELIDYAQAWGDERVMVRH